ncbi:hypothetical protein L211DRAFT_854596 [Terfezia boudieri ATCC MYA-4762]|uniref:Uncharacterized protein n=1 Tax=Terfezia boudieri ATCC MYA-4762 TaxID=1051890 RepID=A0A3N4LJ93_9PEZI|nr:hypothetical protein L211DRAFT_854596 [Terfezia boudieri ATCC MYA-4762]
MGSRTDSSPDSRSGSITRKAKLLSAPSLKLKRASALPYNYIKPKTCRSATETLLFQKVSTVIGAMSKTEKAAMLCPERGTRSGSAPPIPSPKDVREFEAMNDIWLGYNERSPSGDLTPKPSKRTRKAVPQATELIPQGHPELQTAHLQSQEPQPTTDCPNASSPPRPTAQNDATVKLSADIGTSIFLQENTSKKTVQRMAGSVVTGAYSTVGEITRAASGAINWLSQMGFENIGRELLTTSEEETLGPSSTGENWKENRGKSPMQLSAGQALIRYEPTRSPSPSRQLEDGPHGTPEAALHEENDEIRGLEKQGEIPGGMAGIRHGTIKGPPLMSNQNSGGDTRAEPQLHFQATRTDKRSDAHNFPTWPMRRQTKLTDRLSFAPLRCIEILPQLHSSPFYCSPRHYRSSFFSTSFNHNRFNWSAQPPFEYCPPSTEFDTSTAPSPALQPTFGFNMSQDDFKRILEEMLRPLHQKIDAATAIANNTKTANMNARKTEIEAKKRLYDEELKAIDEGIWTTPFDMPPVEKDVVLRNQDAGKEWKRTPRFDPSTMPKFRHDDDLELWLIEMEQFVDTHRETVVCPQIAFNCFLQKDPVRIWYSMLGGRNHANITKEAGCWFNFQMKMRETWLKSISVTQREAEDRCKLPEEPFLIYYFQKLRMLAMAFPESKETTHIARIRAKFNDAQADHYIREQDSLSRFASEIRQYDDHLKLHPPVKSTQHTRSPYQTTSSTPYSRYQNNAGLATQQPLRSRLLLPATAHEAPKARDRAAEYSKRNEARVKTIADRLNPATNKKTRSFLRSDRVVKFIERPCEFCEKLGKRDQWHFGFECGTRAAVHTVWIETLESDSDSDNNSIAWSVQAGEDETEANSGKV